MPHPPITPEPSIIRSTLRALLQPRRLIPIVLVTAALAVAQRLADGRPGSSAAAGAGAGGGHVKVLVADDEALARRRLVRLLSALADVVVAGECADVEQVLQLVRAGGIDVVLLDIQMPGLTGFEALQLFPDGGPQVIFCTAHTAHAVAAFDVGAVDYLLKPIEAARLRKALERAREKRPPSSIERLSLPTRQGIVLIDPRQVSHAELDGQLVSVFTTQGTYLCATALQDLESRLPADRFMRVHRQALVNLEHIARLEPTDSGGFVARTTTCGTAAVSPQAARELRRRLGL